MTRLAELISPSGRRAQSDVHLPVYSVTKHRGFVPSLEYFNKQVFAKDLSSYKVVRANEFAYATIHLDEGSIGIAPEDGLISPMYTIFKIDAKRVDRNYLLRLLKAPTAIAQYATLGRGTAERRKSISLESLGRLRIALPTLPEQRRIEQILERAEHLYAIQRRQIGIIAALESSLLKELFEKAMDESSSLTQFGDLVVNSLIGLDRRAGEQREDKSTIYVRMNSITADGRFELDATRKVDCTANELAKYELRDGDLLFNTRNSRELVGKAAIYSGPRGAVFNNNILRVRFHDRVVPQYVAACLRHDFVQDQIEARKSGTTSVFAVYQRDLATVRLPIPSREKQEEFRVAADNLLYQRHIFCLRLAKLDELFASLQHRAFNGEL